MKKLVIPLICLLFLCGCESREIRATFRMDTVISWDITHPDAKDLVSACDQDIGMWEQIFSAHIKNSDVDRFNESGEALLSEETAEIVKIALEAYESTSGAYDITIAPLVRLWNITHGDENWLPPVQADIDSLLKSVGSEKLSLENRTLTAPKGTEIDLGGIAKGYALGKTAQSLAKENAVGTVSFGGNIAVIGKKSDGSPWRVGIKNPAAPETLSGAINVDSGIVAVSGGYERYTEYEGKRYHHILDPKTGLPSESDLASAVVWVKQSDAIHGAWADALSTALFILGSEQAASIQASAPIEFEYILIKTNGEIMTSPNLVSQFTPTK